MDDVMIPCSVALLAEMQKAMEASNGNEAFWNNCIEMLLKAFYVEVQG